MAWSNWYTFENTSILTNAPEKSGIYRIRFADSKRYFQVVSDGKGKEFWQAKTKGFAQLFGELFLSKNEEPLGVVRKGEQTLSRLIYIGKSDNIQARLQQHCTNNNGSNCVYELSKDETLEFSYMSSEGPVKSELNFYERYIKESGGYCPPCDNCSNECKSKGGICLETSL